MIEQEEDLHSSIPNIRIVREKTIPRWAIDEPDDEIEAEASEDNATHLAEGEEVRPLLMPVRHQIVPEASSPLIDSGIEIIPDPYRVLESTYNEHGYLVERSEYEEGMLIQRERCIYDGENRLIRKATEDPINENLEKEERFYNAEGKISKKVVTYTDGSEVATTYNWSGNDVDEITASDEGVEAQFKKKYDDKGRIIESIEINLDGGTSLGQFVTYNERDLIAEVGAIALKGEKKLRVVSERYSYDDQGHEVQWIATDLNGKERTRTSIYEDGNCVQQVTEDEIGETYTDNTFDDDHHLIRSSTTGPGYEEDTVSTYNTDGHMVMMATRSLRDRTYGRYGSVVP